MPQTIPGVPEQIEGGYHDTISNRTYDSVEAAQNAYLTLKNRLLSINRWQEFSGSLTANFTIWRDNSDDNEKPIIGDIVRINIPGPGSTLGDGYEWVVITKIEEQCQADEEESLLIQAVPTNNPESKTEEIAHFYTDSSTTNIRISRKANTLIASIHGRNEVSNITDTNISDKVRNTIISKLGQLGLSKIQWKALAEGLLDF